MIKNKKLLLLIFVFLLMPGITQAAVLYMEPNEGVFGPGDEFAIDIKIDLNTGCINTIEGEILFPHTRLVANSFMTGESLVSIWVDRPSDAELSKSNQSGIIHFSGGIPGGYCGKIPGDPGNSNIIGRIIFKVPGLMIGSDAEESDEVNISFGKKTRVFLNDGQGTEDILATRGTKIKISDKAITELDWDKLIKNDRIPPEPFIIELLQSQNVYDGKYYIIYTTVDKQTGIDRYEILEIRSSEEIGVEPKTVWWKRILGQKKPAPDWAISNMPYILKDQSLTSVIKVKAIDKAGNERLVEYIPPIEFQKPKTVPIERFIYFGFGFGAIIIVIIIFIIWLIKRLFKKVSRHKTDEEEQI
ncbi:hypothetical protein KAR28_03925 [Candidatus Parcubacteria bacterium]|nr:hypothetical protein [Candidatus Parcubacteria bacterium]